MPLHPSVHDRYIKKSKKLTNQAQGNQESKIRPVNLNGNHQTGFSTETNGREIIRLIEYLNTEILSRLKCIEEKVEYLEQKSQFPVNTLPKFDPYGFEFEDMEKDSIEEKC